MISARAAGFRAGRAENMGRRKAGKRSRTESLQTLCWSGMDSNVQFRARWQQLVVSSEFDRSTGAR
jgi:hypothetical protein